MLSSPCAALISLAMALSQHGSLPDPAADTHAHYQALPRRPQTLKEATYTGGLLLGEVVEWAKGLDPSPTLIHIDITKTRNHRQNKSKVNDVHMFIQKCGTQRVYCNVSGSTLLQLLPLLLACTTASNPAVQPLSPNPLLAPPPPPSRL